MRTPKEWFESMVRPIFQDYLSHPNREHKAEAALCVIAHFDETVFAYLKHCDPTRLPRGKSKAEFRKALDRQRPELKILRDAANARKHGELDWHTKSRPFQFATDAVAPVDGGWYIGGSINRPLTEVLQIAVTFWDKWIDQNPSG